VCEINYEPLFQSFDDRLLWNHLQWQSSYGTEIDSWQHRAIVILYAVWLKYLR
jgi:hypothetical protein